MSYARELFLSALKSEPSSILHYPFDMFHELGQGIVEYSENYLNYRLNLVGYMDVELMISPIYGLKYDMRVMRFTISGEAVYLELSERRSTPLKALNSDEMKNAIMTLLEQAKSKIDYLIKLSKSHKDYELT